MAAGKERTPGNRGPAQVRSCVGLANADPPSPRIFVRFGVYDIDI